IDAFLAYPFDIDQEFQEGLQSILSTAPPEAELSNTILRAQLFYFNRKTGLSLNPHELAASESSNKQEEAVETEKSESQQVEPHTAAPPSAGDAPYPLSFAQLAELIQSNRTDLIPNNDIIPNTVLEGQSSESRTPARRKPWE
ncbi:hypothetical protein DACRYDRAFT_39017, partial [Dacryopinax primogenitus]